MKLQVFFLHSTAGRRVGRRLMTGAQHSSIFVVVTYNMIRCSHGGSILWMYWQDVTLVDSMTPTLICLSGQVEFDFAKSKLSSYPLQTQIFFLSKFFDKRNSLLPKFYPSSFNLRKLGWGDSRTASTSCRSEMSLTGDTAKYLVLTLCRGCALFPQDLVNLFCHEAHFASNGQVKTKTRPFRSNPLDQPGRVPTYQHLPPSVHLAWVLAA
jgi:hypothetical protein